MSKLLPFAILSISMITVMASAAVSPAMANIGQAFPNESLNMIKALLTLPALFIIPFSLLSSVLVRHFGNKKVLYCGILIYIVGGVGPAFVNSFYGVLAFRALLGCGCGLIMPVSQALIAINYEGKLKEKITAYSGAASYFMGVIASFVVAPVSAVNWRYSFYIYFVAVIVLLLNFIALPPDIPSKMHVAPQHMFSKKVWKYIGAMFIINVAFYIVPTNVALFMKEYSIGTKASPGAVISVFMIAGFFAGVLLPYLQKIFKNNIFVFAVFVMAAGYFLLSGSMSVFTVAAGAACVGFSFGILFPAILMRINSAATGSSLMMALSFSACAQFLGQFLSPYILYFAKTLLNVHALEYDFKILFIFLSLALLLLFFYSNKKTLFAKNNI